MASNTGTLGNGTSAANGVEASNGVKVKPDIVIVRCFHIES